MPDIPRRRAAEATPLSVPVFQILLSLSDQDLHGYAIIRDVRERTEGEVELTASTLYAALRRLLDAGHVEELDERPDEDDPRRRYYRITPAGLALARAEAARLLRALETARRKRLVPRKA